jgi:RHS repeat-associated protein
MTTLSASPVGNYYLYSFDGKLLQTYNVYGVLLKDYIYMGDRLIAEYDHVGSRYLFYTPDQINSTRVVTDSAGTVVYSAAHDPYGGIQQTWVNTFDPTPKFSGKERDAESQLDYFGARYYDKAQYRFISVDSMISLQLAQASTQRWNLYAYCIGNPANYIDNTGRYGVSVHYNLTFKIAEMAGLPSELAESIARADLAVDFRFDTTSFNRYSQEGIAATVINNITGIAQGWHFPSGEELARAVDTAFGTFDLQKLGESLHIIQDSFSHFGFKGNHILASLWAKYGGKNPDDPKSNMNTAVDMAMLTLDILRAFRQPLLVLQKVISVLSTTIINFPI